MKLHIFLLCLLLGGCSVLPPAFNDSRIKPVSYNQAIESPENFEDNLVRWGGVIIDLENEDQQSTIKVLFYPLDYYGRPDLDKPSEGYFVIKSPERLDPEQYAISRELIVVGAIAGKTGPSAKYGETGLPLIKANGIHLWPVSYHNNYYWHCPSCYFQQLYW